MKKISLLFFVVFFLFISNFETVAVPNTPELKIVSFKVDVTPPIGEPLAYVPNDKVEHPIYVSGIVLDDGQTRIVWVSCDYICIVGESYTEWCNKIAESAGTTQENVFLHTVHQHDTPWVAPMYNPLPDETGSLVISPEYYQKSLKNVCNSISQAVTGTWQPVKKLLTGEIRVGGLASNRRLVNENGKFAATRFSKTDSPELQAYPVGKIDPILRTICFEGENGQKIAALHFYASHPMAAYRRNMVGPDVPGFALRYVEARDDSEMLNVYFTGCAGDITFGKYNTKEGYEAIEHLGKRLGEAILQNLRHLEVQPIGLLEVVRVPFEVPFDAERCQREDDREIRYLKNTIDLWKHSHVTRLSIGSKVHFLSFGISEVFIDYQLYAQSLIPEHFLATAAYGNGIYWYIPTATAFEEGGGYETGPGACLVTPVIDPILRKAIRDCFDKIIHNPNVF
jgi:hypothetical protein